MARKNTQGYYCFEDGLEIWSNGFSQVEKKNMIIKHGKIVRFIPTYYK